MKFLFDVLKRDKEYTQLLSSIEKGRLPLAASGLSGIHKAAVAAALSGHLNKRIMLLTQDEASAAELKDNLTAMGCRAADFPSRDYNLADLTGFSREYEHKRIDTLSGILDGDFDLLCVSLDSALQYTLPPDVLSKSRFTLKVGEEIDIKVLAERLLEAGYVRSELTDGKGLFSVRGGIMDIFPTDSMRPYRIEFWGDEIDSISIFEVDTQRRMEQVREIKIGSAREIVFSPPVLAEKLKGYLKSRKKLTDKQRTRIERDIESLENGITISPDRYIPIIYEDKNTVFDYMNDAVIIVCESGNIAERIKSLGWQQGEDVKGLLEEGFLSRITADLWLDKAGLLKKLQNAVYFENFARNIYEMPLKELLQFDYKRSTPWSGDTNILKEDISYILSKGGEAVILAGEERAAKVLTEELNEKGINAVFVPYPESLMGKGVTVCCGGLSSGIEIPTLNFLLITHRHIQSDTKVKAKKSKNAKSIGSLDELKRGDYVVHTIHGIGIFDGINRITNDGVTKDYIKIKYNGTDVLYVPVTQLDLVSKYIGAAEDGHIRLNKLGGTEWQRTKSRVKSAVKNMAKQLTALYAKRMATKGYAFSADTDLQSNFERRFEYDETEDQLRCINEIKRDMESTVPMDRLLCGDVGFGKTEVALRAAFKCISEGKQCALLVPTTILAMQHYNTVLKRFGELPVTVKLLSRFVTPKQQEKIISDLKKGRVDMVVGTHRLISKDVSFKDIGLVIIDEEQRFGVAQKERLKELYPHVDILTLSATPIPRTLNMAMSGLRDMSTIDEAPGDRHPVQTYVLEYNQNVLVDAINKEIRRGGQIYYLHNRVDDITRVAAKLKEQIPEARFGIAHGKMSEEDLSEIWRKLIEHEIDVLVCTTIIETGVDVPNANTLIIEDADRMGLSQLHQLRGRVGRSPRRAYAYFCFRRGRQLSEISAKRLEAIREYTEFGSGFKIALRDLEIRGAGSILGGEQHGNMEAVGYDMYLKLLSDAINEENGIEVNESAECTIDLNISAHIPESYIEALPSRVGIYKRIADIKDEEDVSD
ncbi:MAG: transcription-repair coupling factor, partial [Clostridia bacterium]|nr:transcription-repair coupling factor [Clostridia bacterium]